MAKGTLNIHVKEKGGKGQFEGFLPFTVELEDAAGNRKHLAPGKAISGKPYKIRLQDHGRGKYHVSLTTSTGTGDPDYTIGDQEALFHQGWCLTDKHQFKKTHDDHKQCDHIVELTLVVDANNENKDHDLVFEITPIAPEKGKLADQPVKPAGIDTPCATCDAVFTTPGTMYYQNVNWYNNCRNNPPCS